MEKYHASNQKVANSYFAGNLDALFPAPKPAAPGTHKEALTYDDAARLLLYLLHEQEDEICFRILQDRLRRR